MVINNFLKSTWIHGAKYGNIHHIVNWNCPSRTQYWIYIYNDNICIIYIYIYDCNIICIFANCCVPCAAHFDRDGNGVFDGI
jgi:hypothetical protein